MNQKELKDLLEVKYEQFNSFDFIATDPIQIPHQFQKKQDIEIMGLLVSIIAWGNRKSIIKNGNKLVTLFEQEPYNFIKNASIQEIKKLHFIHRTFQPEDLHNFLIALKSYYLENDSLESSFKGDDKIGISDRIVNFRNQLGQFFETERTQKHLANPHKGSSAKRINMYLRWMVRQDNKGVDFGIWKNISPSLLHLPLDVHTGNVARKLGLLKRKQNDWKAVEEITKQLQEFDSQDPCKYDFALFGLGAFEKF